MTPEAVARKYGDKPSFAMTCNLLSQFIKDKGSIPDLATAAAAQGARPPASKNLVPGAAARSMELFPQRAGLAPAAIAHLTHGDCSRMPAPAPAPLTIFYGGRVVVFDDFPADKARDLMHFAAAAGKGRFVPPADAISKPTNPIAAVGQNVPIARKASLHRFLEKRKDRINAKTPYQDAGSPMVVKKEESEPWLGLGSQSSKLML